MLIIRTLSEIFNGSTKLSKDELKIFRERCLNDLHYWCTQVLGWELGDMHKQWSTALNNYDRISVQSFRESRKTTVMLIGYATRDIYFRSNRRGIVYGHTGDLANEKLDRIVDVCLDNELLAPLIPGGKRDRESKSELRKHGSYSIKARAIGSPARGMHPHWIVIDDPFEDKMRFTHAFIRQYFFKTVFSMFLGDGSGHLIIIATPQTIDDLLHDERITTSKKWKNIFCPGILDFKNKIVSWPEMFSFEKLMQKREDIGAIEFEQEIQLNPSGGSSHVLFPQEELSLAKSYTHQWYQTDNTPCIMVVDPAFSDHATADNCVFLLGYKDEEGHIIPIHITAGTGYDEDSFINELQVLCSRFHVTDVHIEKNSVSTLRNKLTEIKLDNNPNVNLFVTTRTFKLDIFKEFQRILSSKKIDFPSMTIEDELESDLILHEINKLGFDKERKFRALEGKDDRAICIAMLCHFINDSSSGFISCSRTDYTKKELISSSQSSFSSYNPPIKRY